MKLNIPGTAEQIKEILDSDSEELALFGLAVIQCNRVENFFEGWAIWKLNNETLAANIQGQPMGRKIDEIRKLAFTHEIVEQCAVLNKKRIMLDHGVPAEVYQSTNGGVSVATGMQRLLKSKRRPHDLGEIELKKEFLHEVILEAAKICGAITADIHAAARAQGIDF